MIAGSGTECYLPADLPGCADRRRAGHVTQRVTSGPLQGDIPRGIEIRFPGEKDGERPLGEFRHCRGRRMATQQTQLDPENISRIADSQYAIAEAKISSILS